MPRLYHSPSSADLGARCQRAWAHCYIDGLRDKEIVWTDDMAERLPPGVTAKQRSGALGTAAHSVLEAWYEGRQPAWDSYPGRVVEAGRHLLPAPDAVRAIVESPIGSEPIPYPEPPEDDRPTVGFRFDGVLWVGFRDLLVHGPAELRRLQILAPSGVALFDYKTTASIAKYAKDATALRADLQCNLYALATLTESTDAALPCRWVYFETKAVRRAMPTDVLIERTAAEDRVGRAGQLCRELDAIERSSDAPMNVNACGDYRGCSYHESKGGPCPGEGFSFVSVLDLNKGNRSMALTEELKAKFAKFGNKSAAATESAAGDGVAASETPPTDGEAIDTGSSTPGPVVEAPKKPAAKKATTKAAPAGSLADDVAKFQAEISAAEAELLAARTRLDTAVAGLRARLA